MEHQYQGPFARMFYPSAKGWATIRPSPRGFTSYASFLEEGVQIGDLVYRLRDGNFTYIGVNVTKAADDPRNRNRVPEGFQHIHLKPGIDYLYNPSKFEAPSVWGVTDDATKPFESEVLSDDSSTPPWKTLRFRTLAKRGAYFALPCGASSYECTESGLEKLRRYALANTTSWYRFIISDRMLEMENGDLCLVTGCDKTPYWAVGNFISGKPGTEHVYRTTFPPVFDENGEHRILEQLAPVDGSDILQYGTEPVVGEDAKFERHNQCLAIRAFHVRIESSVYNGFRTPRSGWERFWRSHSIPFLRRRLKSWPVVSGATPPYDPCTTLTLCIQSSFPSLVVIAVHDSEIASILEEGEICLPDDKDIINRMMKRFNVAVNSKQEASLTLRRNSTTVSRADLWKHRWHTLRTLKRQFILVHL